MRGQTYTVMNMLVWAVFGLAFLAAAYAAYHFLLSQTPALYIRRLREGIASAWSARHQSARLPIVLSDMDFPPGAVVTPDFVRMVVGNRGILVSIEAGPGFKCQGDAAVATGGKKATVLVCCGENYCKLWLNKPYTGICPTSVSPGCEG